MTSNDIKMNTIYRAERGKGGLYIKMYIIYQIE